MKKQILRISSEEFFKDHPEAWGKLTCGTILRDMRGMKCVYAGTESVHDSEGIFLFGGKKIVDITIYRCNPGVTLKCTEDHEWFPYSRPNEIGKIVSTEVTAWGDDEESIDKVAQKLHEAIKNNRK